LDKFLEIRDLVALIEGKPILKGLSLSVGKGSVHAIMGPNGSGKSTFAKVLAGHPAYEVVQGAVWFQGKSLLELAPEERAHLGLFMSFQYPLEIAGISNRQFLREALNAQYRGKGWEPLSEDAWQNLLERCQKEMGFSSEFLERNLNEGFSGGEKKRNEILQLLLFEPKLAILDETDSGLDIDAMRVVAKGINAMRSPDRSFLIITHYQRLLDLVRPDFVHVLSAGKIERTGGPELALELEHRGYQDVTI
jgi:Fe-S cluster assembly ATP-binding protein